MVYVYNTKTEDHTDKGKNNFYIGRSKTGNVLGNPFTFTGKRSNIAKLSFRTREEAIKAYEVYFDKMYGNDPEFTNKIDEMYAKYKSGEDIYLQCFCHPQPCHGDVIAKKLQEMLLMDKIKEMKSKKTGSPQENQ